jgi:hypothetical protein
MSSEEKKRKRKYVDESDMRLSECLVPGCLRGSAGVKMLLEMASADVGVGRPW